MTKAVEFLMRVAIRKNCKEKNKIAESFGEQYVKKKPNKVTSETLASDVYNILKLLSSHTEFKKHFTIWKLLEVPSIPQDTFTSLC